MILTPAMPVIGGTTTTAVAVRLIGNLDRALIQGMTDALTGLAVSGHKTLIILVRDLVALRDESLDRFIATLAAFQAAGHRIFIAATPAWRKVVRGRGPAFSEISAIGRLGARRQVIICHSIDKRGRPA